MCPKTIRTALTGITLLVATACWAQTPTQSASRPLFNSSSDGVFRPTAPVVDGDRPGDRAGSQNPAQPNPVYSIGKEYQIGPNDLLDVEVLNLENGKRTVRVNQAGYVTLPLIGAVTVAGLTQQQVEAQIATMYGEKYLQNPQVSVFIREFTTERITVDGAVVKPGIYPLVGPMTLLRVIALAGGFGQIANSTQVMLFRQAEGGKRQVATFDVEKIRSGKEPDPVIKGDDLIVVQRDSARALIKDSIFRDVIDSINPFSVLAR